MKKLILLPFIIFNFVNAECTKIDLTDPAYLKEKGKENLIEHFKVPRDQDSVGWCGAYASSDSLSFAIGEPVSPLDISIHHYDKYRNGVKLDQLNIINSLSTTDVSREYGYCPESVIPSNQTSSSNLGYTAILQLLESFQEIYDDYTARGRPSDYCVDCTQKYEKVIKPSLPGVTTEIIKEVLLKNKRESVGAFRELLDKLCAGRRIKVNPRVDKIFKNKLGNQTIASVLDTALDNNSMPTIGINTSFFVDSKSVPGGHGPHSMLIVAKRMNSNNKCEYLIRNSYGRGCSYYQKNIADKCDPATGNFWMDQDQLHEAVTDVIIIQVPNSNTLNNQKKKRFFSFLNNNTENKTKYASEPATKIDTVLPNGMSTIWKSFSKVFKY